MLNEPKFRMITISLAAFAILFCVFPSDASGFIAGTWTVNLGPSEYQYYRYEVEKGDGLIAWISVKTGINISIFIVNNTQHELLLNGSSITVIKGIPEMGPNPNSFSELSLQVPYDDMWYVYVLNQDKLHSAEIKLGITEDDEGPIVESVQSDRDEPYFGEVTFNIGFIDESSFYDHIEIYLDDELIDSYYDYQVIPLVTISISIEVQTYDFENGNHTLRIEMEDQFGHLTKYNQSITISNSWINQPEMAQTLFWMSGFFAFLALLVLFVWRPSIAISFTSSKLLLFMAVSSISFLVAIGIEGGFIPLHLSLDYSAPLFGLGVVMLCLTADQGTAYIEPKITSMISKEIELGSTTNQEEGFHNKYMSTEELYRRSDILDKVRNNLRSGMSIIFGVGTTIFVWFVNYTVENSLSQTQSVFLISGFLLALIIAIGIIVSFFPLTVKIGDHVLDESYITELRGNEYVEGVSQIVKMKLSTINRMRYAIGIGLSVFIFVNLIFFSSVIILDITHSFYGIIPFGSAAVSLIFVMYATLRIITVLLGPILMDISVLNDIKTYLEKKLSRRGEID